ncbi:phage tail tape measure protein [Acinetobacter bereziniae]|uniref:Phage tail tape measure protein n=1 Tax=Acinetobacter bereziniae TaxID=106648 RepID=A0A8I1DI00_ACIBZ|nr:phage tail tape measure protein [Acinetobacter bereziniae]QQC82993.1 phage tail tape measure protein [Acinetobacter bereziniae]UUN96141.1 phage tail tape measure protein [Acinetobacter bereziniae]
MAGKNTTVSLTLTVKGQQASAEIKKLTDQQVQGTNKINRAWTQIGSAQARFVNTAKAGTQATMNTARAGDHLLRTNRMLEGVLRQQSIQTKLQSQMLKQQANTVQQIARGMKQAEQSSKRTQQNIQQTSSMWQRGASIAGGTIAGGMFVSNAMQKPRDYAQQMTYIAATATGGQGLSAQDRLKRIQTLEQYVKDSVRQGGGKREDVAAALNELIASGKYDVSNVKPALMTSAKTAFAAGADTIDAAKMTIAMQNFGVKDINLAQDRAMRAGQIGSFEYKDMAKYLPEQMAAARASGYSGDAGLVKLLALNQMAKSTSADSASAGNNVVNLLQKLSSREFSDSIGDAVSIESGDPTRTKGTRKPKTVFDWTTYSQEQRSQGVYGVEAFVKLLERQLAGNQKYQSLQTQIQSATTPDAKKAILGDMSNIALGSNIGQIIADRQALMAALAVVYNKDSSSKLENQISNASGTVDADLAMIKQTGWYKDQALDQEKLFAQSKAYDAVSSSLGEFKEFLTKIASENENLAAITYGTSVAVGGLALAAGTAAFSLNSMGGIPDISTATGNGKGKGGTSSKASKLGGLAQVVGVGALAVAADDAVTGLFDKAVEKVTGYKSDKRSPMEIYMDAQKQKESQDNSQMIAQQQAASKFLGDIVNKLNSLINVTIQNKPIPITMPNVGGLLGDISKNAVTEEKRHGAALLMYKSK